MLLVTISTCLVLLITIDEGFWCFNPTHKLGYRLPTLLGVALETLGVTLYFLSQGGGAYPTRGTERRHGGTDDTDITRNFLTAE